jgi:hypothetical protein
MPPKRTGVPRGTGTGLTPSTELSATSTPKSGTASNGAPSATFESLVLGKAPALTRRSSRTPSHCDDTVQSEVPEKDAASRTPSGEDVNIAHEVPRRRGRPSKNAPKTTKPASQSPHCEDASDVAPPDYQTSSVAAVDEAELCPKNGEDGEAVACPDVLTQDQVKSCTETAADDAESCSRNDGKAVACPDVLTADNASGLEVIQLIDFWGPDGSKPPKSRVGTLEDPREPDLKVGDRVLLLAPEEGDFGKHQLCYRHAMVVKEVGRDGDAAFHDQVKLKFEKFPNPKYDIWHPKRSWEMERITKERVKECQLFNRLYAQVKKYMSEQNKRSHRDAALMLSQPKKHQKGFLSFSKDSNDKQGSDVPSEASAPSRQTSAESETSDVRKKRSSKSSAEKDVAVSKSKQRALLPDSSDDEPIVRPPKALHVVRPAAASAHPELLKTQSESVKHVTEAAPVAKKPRRPASPSSSSSAAEFSSSSSSSSSSQDSEDGSDIGAKRKKSKSRQPSRTAAKSRESSAPPSQEVRQKPLSKIKKEEKEEKLSDSAPSSTMPASKVRSDSSSLPSQLQHGQRPVSGPTANVLKTPVLSSSTQPESARVLANIPKASGSQAIPRPLTAGIVTSGSITPAASIKPCAPVKELDLEQRWRMKQAAAAEIKRELPPLPSLQSSSLPSLPALPTLPSLAAAKSKTPVVADKPAVPKVAPPSPVHKCAHAVCPAPTRPISHCDLFRYVCGPPFRELSSFEDSEADLVMGESIEALLTQVCPDSLYA